MSASLAAAWPASDAPQRAPWALAVAAGLVIGAAQTLWFAILSMGALPMTWSLLERFASRWMPFFVVMCCALLHVTRLFHARAGAGAPWHQFAWTVGWAVLAALLFDPLWSRLIRVVNEAFGRPPVPPWDKFTLDVWLAAILSRSLPAAAILATMWVCVDRYVAGARRSAQALASAQLRLASAQRRVLDEQLCSMQAQVDPAFLFGTLTRVEDGFESAQAQRLLDALIRYLRAAQHGVGEPSSTVGRQIELVRAYLEIEAERAQGRLRARVEAPELTQSLPLAPLIVPPLVTWAVQRADEAPLEIAVSVALRDDAIMVEVVDDAVRASIDPSPIVAEVRQRLHALYGDRAGLSVAAAPSRGTVVSVVVPLVTP